jgi:hypothetical protein
MFGGVTMTWVRGFLGDRRGVAAIDYAFAAALAIGVRDLATVYGRVVSMAIRHTMGIA